MSINKKIVVRLVYIFITIGIIVFVGLIDPNLPNVFSSLHLINVWWIIAGSSGIILFWLFEGFIIQYMASFLHGKIKFLKCQKIGIIGQYYCALTPGASGGQPMQVMYLKREGVSIGTGTCMMCIKFICYLASISSFILLGYLLSGKYIYENHNQAFWLTMICFAGCVIGIVFIFFVFSHDTFIQKFSTWIVNFLCKIKIMKNKEKALEDVSKLVTDFKGAVKYIKKYRKKVFITYLLSVIQMAGMFFVVCFLYIATGMHGGNLYEVFIMQAFMYTTVSFIPTPGTAGAAEAGFYLFMALFFPANLMFVILVIWRFITYYSTVIVGAVIVIADEVRIISRNKRAEKEGN